MRGAASHFQFTKDATDRAIQLYEQAIALDPQYALAHSALAGVMNQRKVWAWSTDLVADASKAMVHARHALRLGRQDPSILAQSSCVLIFCGDEVELADSLLEEAIQLNPNAMYAWTWGGFAKSILGDHRTAIDYFRRALRLSPLDPRIFFAQNGLANANFFLGNYEEALKHATAVLRHHPNYVGPLRIAMACHALGGNIEAAQRLWRQVVLLSPSDRVSTTGKRSAWRREQDLARLREAYRLAGMPE